MNIGLLIVRLAVGLTLAAHGSQKLFGWFGGGGISGTAPILESLGFRPGRVSAAMAGIAEFGGGLFLALGLLTPLAASVLVGVMIVAIVSGHWANGFFLMKNGYEYAFVAAAAGLAFTGPGALSADEALGLPWPTAAPVAALVLGVLAAAVQLSARRTAPVVAAQGIGQ